MVKTLQNAFLLSSVLFSNVCIRWKLLFTGKTVAIEPSLCVDLFTLYSIESIACMWNAKHAYASACGVRMYVLLLSIKVWQHFPRQRTHIHICMATTTIFHRIGQYEHCFLSIKFIRKKVKKKYFFHLKTQSWSKSRKLNVKFWNF